LRENVKYVVTVIITIWFLLFIIDNLLIKSKKDPLFCNVTTQYSDGGSTEFYCLGYKINRYVKMSESNFDVNYELGTWSKEFEPNEKSDK